MKLKESFISQQLGDVNVLISKDTGLFPGLVKSNSSAAFIIEQLREDTTKESILSRMKDVYSGNEELMKRDIDKVVDVLSRINALE